MKILVTGGAGFIGSHLVNRLIEEGHEVVVLDDLSTGKKEHLNPKAKLVKGDVKSDVDVAKAIKGCEAVFHLAAQTDVKKAMSDPDYDFKVNFSGSKNIFEAAGKIGAKVIFVSSAAVYGDSRKPAKETDELKPISHYGKNKMKAEKLLNPGNAFIARLFNVYGHRGHGVVSIFCEKIPKYDDIKIFGTGLQTRDFVYVSDVVDALMLGLKKNGIYNIGTGKETTLINLTDHFFRLTKAKPHIKFAAELPGDIKRSCADVSKIKQELGWSPKVNLEKGLEQLLKESGFKKLPV